MIARGSHAAAFPTLVPILTGTNLEEAGAVASGLFHTRTSGPAEHCGDP